jgi:hypothetical protein
MVRPGYGRRHQYFLLHTATCFYQEAYALRGGSCLAFLLCQNLLLSTYKLTPPFGNQMGAVESLITLCSCCSFSITSIIFHHLPNISSCHLK